LTKGTVDTILNELHQTEYGEHLTFIHPRIPTLSKAYSRDRKTTLYNNEILLLPPYYETIDEVEKNLSESNGESSCVDKQRHQHFGKVCDVIEHELSLPSSTYLIIALHLILILPDIRHCYLHTIFLPCFHKKYQEYLLTTQQIVNYFQIANTNNITDNTKNSSIKTTNSNAAKPKTLPSRSPSSKVAEEVVFLLILQPVSHSQDHRQQRY
jgi:hypothetical protein